MFSGWESICRIKTAEMGSSAEDGGEKNRNWMLRDKSNSHERLNLTVKREGGQGRECKSFGAVSHPDEYQQCIHHVIAPNSSLQ